MQLQAGKRELTDADFLALIQARERSIYRVAYGYVQNPEDAKDIVQEAVCKAYVGKKRLKDPGKFYPWFFRILANTAVSFLHQSSRTASIGLEELDLSDCGVSDIAPLSGLTGLTRLDLSGNSISDLTPLSGLTGLTYLNLSGNPIPDFSPVEDRDGLILIR